MGWFIRKGFGGHGPVRVNLSKSGLGLSAGVKGARVGAGPAGPYVHGGRHGLYYRKRVSGSRSSAGTRSQSRSQQVIQAEEQRTQDISDVVTGSTQEFVDEINSRLRLFPFWPVVPLPFLVLGVILGGPTLMALVLLGLVGAVVTWATLDRRRRTVHLEYELDDWGRQRVEALEGILALDGCHIKRQVLGTAEGVEWKRNAGSDRVYETGPVRIVKRAPKGIKTDVVPVAIECKAQTLYFLPDHLFVYKDKRYGVLPYEELEVRLDAIEFPERDQRPNDALFLETRWQKMNKDGSRDKRFKENREVPVYRYAEFALRHPGGFKAVFHFSTMEAVTRARDALARVAAHTKSDTSLSARTDGRPRSTRPGHRRLRCPQCGTTVEATLKKRLVCPSCGHGKKA